MPWITHSSLQKPLLNVTDLEEETEETCEQETSNPCTLLPHPPLPEIGEASLELPEKMKKEDDPDQAGWKIGQDPGPVETR